MRRVRPGSVHASRLSDCSTQSGDDDDDDDAKFLVLKRSNNSKDCH